MKSITIHNIDDELVKELAEYSETEKLSLNRSVKKLLRESLGMTSESVSRRRQEFIDVFGAWTEEEYQEFVKNTKDNEKIDPEDWL